MRQDNERRSFLRYLAILGLATFSTSALHAKISKELIKYQDTPAENGDTCATCGFFNPEDNTCKVVEGDISPQGWCIYYVKGTKPK